MPLQTINAATWCAQVRNMLPYTRWLDWCKIAYFVSEEQAQKNLRELLQQLEKINDLEITQKFEALRGVRHAFVFRRGSTVDMPSAPEFILAEACHSVRRNALGLGMPEVAGGAHTRCLLGIKKGKR